MSKLITLCAVLAGMLAGQDSRTAAAAPKEARFALRNELKVLVPAEARKVRVWFAYPREDANQTVRNVKIESPLPHRLEKDADGNTFVYVEAIDPKVKELTIVETFDLARREHLTRPDAAKSRPLSAAEIAEHMESLEPDANVVIDADIQKLAAEITKGERNPVTAARLIYDWELANVDYWVKDPAKKKASPVGSTKYCLETRTGNCTDIHSLWTSLARASGIPTRMVYGSFLKADLDGKDRDQSYHCWPEFFAPGIGWIPHDVAVADIFAGEFPLTAENTEKVKLTTPDGYSGPDPAKVNWYFGNLDARRVTWSVGRDLMLNPKQDGGPVNALPKAYVEVDGKVHPETTGWVRKLTYTSVKD
jgi:transglutaminase-like putative cysteine protease